MREHFRVGAVFTMIAAALVLTSLPNKSAEARFTCGTYHDFNHRITWGEYHAGTYDQGYWYKYSHSTSPRQDWHPDLSGDWAEYVHSEDGCGIQQ